MEDGIRHSYSVAENDAGTRIDVFLAGRSGLSRSRVKTLIKDGNVALNGNSGVKPSYPVEGGDTITMLVPPVKAPGFEPEDIPLDILYQDEFIIIVNKPAGMVVHPAHGHSRGTLAAALLHRCAGLAGIGEPFKPGIVHRLDMNTSGLLVVALTEKAFAVLSQMVRDREVQRYYTAFVWGHPDPDSGTIDAPIGRHPRNRTLKAVVEGGRPSITLYKTIARYEFISRLEVELKTGRTHQIRVHLASIGHHVFGDPDYGGREKRLKGFSPEVRTQSAAYLKRVTRQALHASRLVFDHPVTGKRLSYEAQLPPNLAWLQEQLDHE